jgi:hypothetical protein
MPGVLYGTYSVFVIFHQVVILSAKQIIVLVVPFMRLGIQGKSQALCIPRRPRDDIIADEIACHRICKRQKFSGYLRVMGNGV